MVFGYDFHSSRAGIVLLTIHVSENIIEARIMQYNGHYGEWYLIPMVESTGVECNTSDSVDDSTSIPSILHHIEWCNWH